MHEAEYLRLLDVTALEAVLSRANGRRGVAQLRALTAADPQGHTRSGLEDRFLALCARAALPAPRINQHVSAGGALIEVDFLWPEHRLIVEVDGWAAHGTRNRFERDRARDADLTVAGYRVVRFTWREIVVNPGGVVATLAALLGALAGLNH